MRVTRATLAFVTHNRLEYSRQAFVDLQAKTDFPHELIVIDNGSTDGTAEWLNEIEPAVRATGGQVIRNETNLGMARALNQALRLMGGDCFVRVDNDCLLIPHWLTRLADVLNRGPEIGWVGLRHQGSREGELQVRRGIRVYALPPFYGAYGTASAIPGDVLAAIGGFCEDYGLFGEEDYDYAMRVTLAGYQIAQLATEEYAVHLDTDSYIYQGDTGATLSAEAQAYRTFKEERARKAQALSRLYLEAYATGAKPLYVGFRQAPEPPGADSHPQAAKGSRPTPRPQERGADRHRIGLVVSWYDRRFLSAARRLEQALEGRHEVYLFVRHPLPEEQIRQWVGQSSHLTFVGLDEEVEESLACWRRENDLQILLDLDPRVADQRYLNDLTIAQLAAFLDQPLPDHVRLTWRLEDRTAEVQD
jgi:hypothetical protein